MNLIAGKVQAGHVVTASGTKLPLPKSHKASIGQNVIYGIRPEDLTLGKGIKAKITVTEPTGPEIHVYSELEKTEICAIIRDRQVFKRDSIVDFAPQLEKVHLFDANTKMAIR